MIVFPALVEFLDNINGPHMMIIMLQYMCGRPSCSVEYEYKVIDTSVYHDGRRD